MAFPAHEEPAVTQETCAAILEKAKLENWAMGKTKVRRRNLLQGQQPSYKASESTAAMGEQVTVDQSTELETDS